jgi:hypothetical protein
MNEKLEDAFFYGLYMDVELLRSLGTNPQEPTLARLPGYRLELRGAVKALPQPGKSVWGVISKLTGRELDSLYSSPATRAYRPVPLVAITIAGLEVPVTCYNQPVDPSAALNATYLDKLLGVCRKIGLPADYVAELEDLRGKP